MYVQYATKDQKLTVLWRNVMLKLFIKLEKIDGELMRRLLYASFVKAAVHIWLLLVMLIKASIRTN